MYCTACGKELHNDAVVCMACGVATTNIKGSIVDNEANLAGWTVLGFFVPIVGLILYLIWKEERPRTSRALGKGAIGYLIFVSVIFTIYFYFFGFIFSMAIMFG